mmetsp:Transcript_32515/g.33847  ORF Transcript_32515/g.33847 Transcript_32515/m.33847 type:complete len:258 (-) Transcript_32515:1059-1832(-)
MPLRMFSLLFLINSSKQKVKYLRMVVIARLMSSFLLIILVSRWFSLISSSNLALTLNFSSSFCPISLGSLLASIRNLEKLGLGFGRNILFSFFITLSLSLMFLSNLTSILLSSEVPKRDSSSESSSSDSSSSRFSIISFFLLLFSSSSSSFFSSRVHMSVLSKAERRLEGDIVSTMLVFCCWVLFFIGDFFRSSFLSLSLFVPLVPSLLFLSLSFSLSTSFSLFMEWRFILLLVSPALLPLIEARVLELNTDWDCCR